MLPQVHRRHERENAETARYSSVRRDQTFIRALQVIDSEFSDGPARPPGSRSANISLMNAAQEIPKGFRPLLGSPNRFIASLVGVACVTKNLHLDLTVDLIR